MNRGQKCNGNRDQGHGDRERGRKWNNDQQYQQPGYPQKNQYPDITTTHHLWDVNNNTQSHMNNILCTLHNNNMCYKDHQHNCNKL